MISTDRTTSMLRLSLPFFKRVTLSRDDLVLRMKVAASHIWLLTSGECRFSKTGILETYKQGDWIGIESAESLLPEISSVYVSSNHATFLRIRVTDFRDRLPSEITRHIGRRVRGLARFDSVSFRKEFRISASILPELRDPTNAPPSARLVSVEEVNKYSDDTRTHSDCNTTRQKLHNLIMSAR
jgi:CRP-like cAMP-binding protein